MLPATYVDTTTLRVNQTAVGIFGIAILTAGFSFSALLTFTIRNPLFQADSIHQPCGIASAVGLLTVFYNFIVSTNYTWKTPTLLLAIAAGISTIVYAGLFLFSHRRITKIRSLPSTSSHHLPLNTASPTRNSFATGPASTIYDPTNDRTTSSYQPTGYYENYIRNMYPSARGPSPAGPSEPGTNTNASEAPDANSISEEEMQRQQMLMLLLANEDAHPQQQHQQQQSTFHIDWQGQDQDVDDAMTPPAHGYYAPGTGTGSSSGVGTGGSWPSVEGSGSGATTTMGSAGGRRNFLRPWDGIWRGVTRRDEGRGSGREDFLQQQQRAQQAQQQRVVDGREERRREIELGLR